MKEMHFFIVLYDNPTTHLGCPKGKQFIAKTPVK